MWLLYRAHRPARSGSFHGGAAMRKLLLSTLLTIAALLATVATVLADSTGPGI